MELVCPAGTPSALRTAVDAGADAVYCGFRDETNARNFPGLNFTPQELAQGVAYAHDRGAKVLVAINTFARAGGTNLWHRAVAQAIEARADALILADLGLLAWASRAYPAQRLHLSVQAAAATPPAIRFYAERYGIKRVVLPRVLTVNEIAGIVAEIPCEAEVFAFGGLCVMTEGRCLLSSYATGESPNMNGVCSPAAHVDYRQEGTTLAARLGGFTIDRYSAGQPAAYPTLCKGTFMVDGKANHIFEEPTSLNVLEILPALKAAGVSALKIEGRQRGKAYLAAVVRQFRSALDALEAGRTLPASTLGALTEGGRETTGAYKKTWR
ncbi:MAG: U32 family peptidase [Hyphomicrobiaceae bacterium]|nr:U32 family peptidase [Hyphomicrobiaceae bacterium]